MDETDYKILEILKADARTTNNDIARRVKLTEGAVRNRIRHLLQSGVIRRFTIDSGPDQVEAIILIKTETRGSKEILKRLRRCTNRLFETAGAYDVAAHVTSENIQSINATVDKLRSVNGVVSTVTLLKIADDQLY